MLTDLWPTLIYLARELEAPPFGATTLGVPPGFFESILPHKLVQDALAPGQGQPRSSAALSGQLFGFRVVEYECLPEWGLVWLKGTQAVGVIDLRRAVPKPVDKPGASQA